MKLETNLNGKTVTIELTEEQLIEISKQTSKLIDYKQIISVKLACEVTGDDYDNLIKSCCGLPKDEAAFKQLKVIRNAINPIGYRPNLKNVGEYKYYPYFKINGCVFSYYFTDYCITGTYVPSALSSIDNDRAEFFGKTFIDLFEDLLT